VYTTALIMVREEGGTPMEVRRKFTKGEEGVISPPASFSTSPGFKRNSKRLPLLGRGQCT